MPTATDDRADIADLLARYCLSLDQRDIAAWIELFTPDAIYEVYGRPFKGHEGILRMMSGAPEGLHLGGPPVVTVDGDRARTQQNLLFVNSQTGESRGAVYTDELVRTVNGWRFARRRCQFIVADGLSDRPAS